MISKYTKFYLSDNGIKKLFRNYIILLRLDATSVFGIKLEVIELESLDLTSIARLR